jgi:alpha/beta superfamily hydrolase
MSKVHVYCMPGMAASPSIFERIQLPPDSFEIHLLEWLIPEREESIEDYAQRVAKNIRHDNVILIGVSFGGILVQEMKRFVKPKKVIIISSVKSNAELPKRMKIAKTTKAYKLVPTKLLENIDQLAKFTFGSSIIRQRLKLYEKFLSVRDKVYLDWAIEQIINWKRTEADPEVIHIHGDSDEVFPIKHIRDCIIVKGGTHIMILTKYRWLSDNLPKIMLEGF